MQNGHSVEDVSLLVGTSMMPTLSIETLVDKAELRCPLLPQRKVSSNGFGRAEAQQY
jgi:hypothetical protein